MESWRGPSESINPDRRCARCGGVGSSQPGEAAWDTGWGGWWCPGCFQAWAQQIDAAARKLLRSPSRAWVGWTIHTVRGECEHCDVIRHASELESTGQWATRRRQPPLAACRSCGVGVLVCRLEDRTTVAVAAGRTLTPAVGLVAISPRTAIGRILTSSDLLHVRAWMVHGVDLHRPHHCFEHLAQPT